MGPQTEKFPNLYAKAKEKKTPTVKVLIRCNRDGKLVKIIGLPDMGATIDIIKSSIAKENKMEIIPNDGSLRLVDAEGKPLVVEGLTYIDIQRSDGTWFNSPALVSPTLRDNLLLSHTARESSHSQGVFTQPESLHTAME